MDPNATLLVILTAALRADRAEFAEACEDLAEWLRRGGFRPDVMRPAFLPFLRHVPGTGTGWSLMAPHVSSLFDRWTLVRWDARGNVAESFALS